MLRLKWAGVKRALGSGSERLLECSGHESVSKRALQEQRSGTMTKRSLAILFLACLLVSPAEAHVGVGSTSGLLAGITHPLTGLDHILAMLMIGVWASMLGGRALWLVPASFVSMMMVGGVLGVSGLSMP